MNRFGKSYLSCIWAAAVLAVMAFGAGAEADPKYVFTPGFRIGQIYDDNIYAGNQNREWDFYTSVAPYFNFDWFLRLLRFKIGYQPTFLLMPRHFNDAGLSEFLHNANVSLATQFSGGLSLTVGDSYGTIPFSYSRSPTSPSNLSHQNHVFLRAGYNLTVSPTVDVDLSVNFSRFDASGVISDGYRSGAGVKIEKEFNSFFSLGLDNYIYKYWYDSLSGDPFVYGFGLEPQIRIFSHIKARLSFGYRYLNFTSVGGENSFVYKTNIVYETLEGEVGKLYFSDEFLVDMSGGSFRRRSVGAVINKRLRENLRASFRLSYSWYNDKSALRDDGILETKPSLEFDLGRDFTLETGYEGFFNKWGSSLDKSVSNRFYVILNFQKRLND